MFIDYEIAVIGAGITGASIAAKLCSAGVSVALIDKGAAGSLGRAVIPADWFACTTAIHC